MALGFTLITGGFLCLALALLRLHAHVPGAASRTGRLGVLAGGVSLVLLATGTALWWPVLFLWPDLGPLAGAPVGLGSLSLFGAWLLIGLRAAQEESLPSWLRSLPLALFGLFVLLLLVSAMTSSWPILVATLVPFWVGWAFVAYGIWTLATDGARLRLTDASA